MAADRVFQTAELLEAILLQNIPMLQLFTLQRTCRAFRDTIQGSIVLKRAMFLELPPHPPARAGDPRTLIPRSLNPLLDSVLFEVEGPADGVFCGGISDQERDAGAVALDFRIVSEDRMLKPLTDLGRARPFVRREHSWSKMLVFQAPLPPRFATRLRTTPRPTASAAPQEYHWRTEYQADRLTFAQLHAGLVGAYQKFVKARARGRQQASDSVLEHGGTMDQFMQLAPRDDD